MDGSTWSLKSAAIALCVLAVGLVIAICWAFSASDREASRMEEEGEDRNDN